MTRRKISAVMTALTLAFVMALSPMLVFAESIATVYESDFHEVVDVNLETERTHLDSSLMVELAPYNSNREFDAQVVANDISLANDEYAVDFSATSIDFDSLPFVGGRRTGTLAEGGTVHYRLPVLSWSEINTRREYTFILTMPPNADFDLELFCFTTNSVLAHNAIWLPGVTEHFTVVFPEWILQRRIGIRIRSFGGSGTYTVYAGPTWIGKTMQGNVSLPGGGMGFNHTMNWPAPGTWTLDLSNHPSIPHTSYITSLTLRGTVGGGNIDRTLTLVDQGGTIRGMFPALPIPAPRFNNGNTWSSHPVSGVWADQRLRFGLTMASPGSWTATHLSMGLIFPVTPANLRFV